MADVHAADPALADPDAVAEHHEVRAGFPVIAIALCWAGGAAAVVVGIILGLTLVNN